jgi:hypothetical protein
MPSRGGQNRPLPDTWERLNKSGQHDSAALYQERRRQPPKNERAPAQHRQPYDQHEEARLFAQQGVQPEVRGGDGLGKALTRDGEKGPGEGNSSSEREQLNGNSDSRATGAGRCSGRGGMCQQKPTDSRPSFGRGFEGRRRHSPSTLAHKAEAGAARQQDVRLPRHLEALTGARGGFCRGARQGEDTKTGRPAAVSGSVSRERLTGAELRGANRPQPTPTREQPPTTERVHFGQGDILDERTGARGGFGRGARSGGAEPRGDNRLQPTPTWEQPPSIASVHLINNSLQGICDQERDAWHARMADFFGWSRPLQKSPPSAEAALEAGSARLEQTARVIAAGGAELGGAASSEVAMPSVIAAGGAELSGVASFVDEVALPSLTATPSVIAAGGAELSGAASSEVATPSVIAAGGAELSGVASFVEEVALPSLTATPSVIAAGGDDRSFIVLTETKFSFRCIPVWDRYSPHR